MDQLCLNLSSYQQGAFYFTFHNLIVDVEKIVSATDLKPETLAHYLMEFTWKGEVVAWLCD